MIDILLWVGIGALIGWATPQPEWAKFLTLKIKETYKKLKKITKQNLLN